MNRKLVALVILLCLTAFAVCAPFLFTRAVFWDEVIFDHTGEIGDTIGGLTAPVIGLLNAVLLYLTLREQFEFNEKQKRSVKEDQFKNTFFQLLEAQRNIVTQLKADFLFLKDWRKSNNSYKGLEFFRSARIELGRLYQAYESEFYNAEYDEQLAFDDYESMCADFYHGNNIPKEIEDEQDKKYRDFMNSCMNALMSQEYGISRKAHDEYHRLGDDIDKKIVLIYWTFYSKNENVGYYFRHLYHLLKYIRLEEQEALRSFAKSKEERLAVRGQYHQYAQFIQSQMSID